MKTSLTMLMLLSHFMLFAQGSSDSLRHIFKNFTGHLNPNAHFAELSTHSDLLLVDENQYLSPLQLHRKKVEQLGKCSNSVNASNLLDTLYFLNSFYIDQNVICLSLIDENIVVLDDAFYDSDHIEFDTTNFQFNFNDSCVSYLQQVPVRSFSSLQAINSSTVDFILPKSLVYSDSLLHSIEINFGDGNGYKKVEPDKIYKINYNGIILDENGLAKAYLEIKYKKGSKSYYNKTEVFVYIESIPDLEFKVSTMILNNLCAPFESDAFNEAKVSIRFGRAQEQSKQLKKPLILIEGFDFDLNPNDDRYGDLNFTTVIQGISINEATGLPSKNNLADLSVFADRLYTENYDLVFVNFKDGSADMFRNGNTLIRIIQWVNENKVSNDELIVIGASMGGLLARYALRRMELEGCKHCTKLYGTFDSPHKGANVPLGLQYSVQYLNSKGLDTEYGIRALSSTASQQLLIYNITPGAQAKRKQWQSWLDQNGHPQIPKRIAITNGDPSGKGPYAKGVGLYANCYKTKGVELFKIIINAADPGKKAAYIKLPKGSSGLSRYLKGLRNNYHIANYYFPNETICYDNASGGQATWLYDAHLLINAYVTSFKNNNCSGASLTNHGLTTFIPVFSALDLSKEELHPNISSLFPTFPINAAEKTSSLHPFHAIYYHSSTAPIYQGNQVHVFVDAAPQQNVDWIFKQIYSVSTELPSLLPYNASLKEFNLSIEAEHETLISDLSVIKDGVLHLHAARKENFGQSYDHYPFYTGTTQLYRTSTCGTYIEINDGGKLILGDQNLGSNGNNKAVFRILDGSVLELKKGSELQINDGSVLIIEEGAKLIFHKDATIKLNGANANLNIKGLIVLEQDALFSFSSNSTQKGYVIFDNSKSQDHSNFVSNGSGTSIKFSGLNQYDHMITFKGFIHDLSSKVDQLDLRNLKIKIEEGSGLEIRSQAILQNLGLEGPGQTVDAVGLTIEPSTTTQCQNIYFTQLRTACLINNSSIPFLCDRFFFSNCSDGLVSFHPDVRLKHNTFNACNNACLLVSSGSYNAEQCIFRNNEKALSTLGSTLCDLSISTTEFVSNDLALDLHESTSCRLECVNFIDNLQVASLDRSVLIMSNSNPYLLTAGRNTIANNTYGIKGNGDIYLDHGGNNFIKSSKSTQAFIELNIHSTSPSLSGSTSIAANDNYWSPSPSSPFLGGPMPQFYDINISTPSGMVQGDLNGSISMKPHTSCINYPLKFKSDSSSHLNVPNAHVYEEKIHFDPNPCFDVAKIKMSSAYIGLLKIRVISMTGKVELEMLIEKLAIEQELTLPLDSLSSGTYSLLIDTPDKSYSNKFIKLP